MDWIIKNNDTIAIQLTTPDFFLDWLFTQSPRLLDFVDPYRDKRFDSYEQINVLKILRDLQLSAENDISHYYEKHSRLPQDLEMRQSILSQLIEQNLYKQPVWQLLNELKALLELALEKDSIIECISN